MGLSGLWVMAGFDSANSKNSVKGDWIKVREGSFFGVITIRSHSALCGAREAEDPLSSVFEQAHTELERGPERQGS